MPKRTAEARWIGELKDGSGIVEFGSGAFEGPYSYESRFGSGSGTNPEELIAAAHASCFSMALAGELTKAGGKPESISTKAAVTIDRANGEYKIQTVDLETEVDAHGVDDLTLRGIAERARTNCPVSKALSGVRINVKPHLRSASMHR